MPAARHGCTTKQLRDIVHDIETIDAQGLDDIRVRIRELEAALAELTPEHPLIAHDDTDDRFDASAI